MRYHLDAGPEARPRRHHRQGSGLPSRLVVYGPEGSGKTSLGDAASRPIFVMINNETGLKVVSGRSCMGFYRWVGWLSRI